MKTMEWVISKVVVTAEARFDYESMFGLPLPIVELKRETEKYIDNLINGETLYGCYFRVKYYDEITDRMLMLFFYKGNSFGKMQMWELKGICLAEDWSKEFEESGQVRLWLKSVLNPTEDTDWVWDLRVREEMRNKLLEDYNDEVGD